VGDGDPVGELLSRLAQPFSSYCSKSVGPGFKGILTSDRYSAYNWLAVSQRQVVASQARFHPNCRRTGIGRSGSRLAGAGETPVCLVVSSPRWHLVSSRFERGGCTDSLTSP